MRKNQGIMVLTFYNRGTHILELCKYISNFERISYCWKSNLIIKQLFIYTKITVQ